MSRESIEGVSYLEVKPASEEDAIMGMINSQD